MDNANLIYSTFITTVSEVFVLKVTTIKQIKGFRMN